MFVIAAMMIIAFMKLYMPLEDCRQEQRGNE